MPGYHSTSIDTAFALNAFAAASQGAPETIDDAISYILSQQAVDGSFSLSNRNDSSIYITSMCVTALRQFLFLYDISSQLNLALDYVISAQAATGGWANQWESALALNSIVPLITDKTRYAASVELLRSEQLANGSWSNDAYITALAERAIHLADNIANPVDPANGSITGRVVNLSTGAPLAGVSVVLEQDPLITAISEVDGSFSFNNVPVGSYTLNYSAVGFIGASQVLTVQVGTLLDVGVVNLEPLANTGIIKGTVTSNTDGSPVAGALVSISGAFTASTITDAAGYYEIAGAAGNVVIVISAANYELAIAGGQLNPSSALIFSPALLDVGTIVTGPEVTITGAIIDGETGQPLQGANISVVPTGEAAVSEADGSFILTGLQSGELLISILHSDFLQQQLSLVTSDGATINLGDVRLYHQAPTVSSISGNVSDAITGAPVSAAEVRLVGTANVTTTNAAGDYVFSDLSGTDFTVTASATGYFVSTRSITVAQPANITLNFPLNRSSSANFDIIDMHIETGIYVYGAEAEIEADVLMHNTGVSDKSVRVFYKVVNSLGVTIEEGPTVLVPLNGDPSVASINVLADAVIETSIDWYTVSHVPDDYQIIAQIYDVQTGQLLAERGIGVTVEPTNQISGHAEFDPPITQLASQEPIKITADIMNTGNLVIEPTTVTAKLRLIKEGYKSRQDLVDINGTLTDPSFSQTQGMDIDSSGNIYVVNKLSGTVSVVAPDQTVSVFADNLINPVDVDIDASGNVYILQQDSSFVVIGTDASRVEVATGILSQSGIEAQASGDVFITSGNALYNATMTGVVTETISGGIANPHDMVVAADGTVYIASGDDNSITQYKNGQLSTFVGGINQPYGLAIDINGDLIVTSYGDNTLLRVTPQGVVSVIATGLSGPFDVILDTADNFVVSNMMSNEIVQVDRAGDKTVIGEATTNLPNAAVYNASGELFVGNVGSGNIIKYGQVGVVTEFANGIVDPAELIVTADGGLDVLQGDGTIYHVAPDGTKNLIVNGRWSSTGFVNAPDGNGYVTVESSRHLLARVDSTGQFSNYLASALGNVQVMASSISGNIYAVSGSSVYKISPDYQIQELATGLSTSFGIAVDATENVYVTQYAGREVLKIDTTGNVTIEASTPFNPGAITVTEQGDVLLAQYGGTSIYQLATGGVLNEIVQSTDQILFGLAQDANGDIWTSNQNASTVTRISSTGVIDTFTGATLPGSILLDGVGGVYVSAYQGIKHIDDTGVLTNAVSYSSLTNTYVQTFAVDANGHYLIPGPSSILYLLDSNSNLVNRFTSLKTPREIMDDGTGILYLVNANGIVKVRGEGYMPEVVVPGSYRSIARETATTAIVSGGGAPQRINLVTGEIVTQFPFSHTTLGFIKSIATNPAGGFTLADYGDNRLIFYGVDDRESDIQVGIVSPRGMMLDQAGNILVANEIPRGIVTLRNDHRADAYIVGTDGFDYLLPKGNGNFYATLRANGNIYEYDTRPARISSIQAPESEAIALVSDGGLYSTAPSLGALVSISTDGLHNYQQLATGLSDAVDVETAPDGTVFISDKNRNSIVTLNQNNTLTLDTINLQDAAYISFTPNGDRVVTYATNHLALLVDNNEPADLLLTSLVSNTAVFGGVVVDDAGLIHVSTTSDNSVLKINNFGSEPEVVVGDVVFQKTETFNELPLETLSPKIDFGSWVPSISGEYQVEITADNGITTGSLINTIHVGAKAEGLLMLDEVTLSTGDRPLGATLSLSGIDTTKFTYIDPLSVTLDSVTGATNGRGIAADTKGNVYALDSNRIVKVTPEGVASDFSGIDSGILYGQMMAIDSGDNVYLANGLNIIKKITPEGVKSDLVSIHSYATSGFIAALAVGYDDTLFALVYPDKLLEIDTLTGAVTQLPVEGLISARYLTIDALGNKYIVNQATPSVPIETIIRVTQDGVTSEVFDGAYFEYEGQPFTADCSNNLLFSPISFSPIFAGEEYAIYQLIGETGEFSQIFHGSSAPQNIYDMDVLYYDRFGHRLLIYTDFSGGKVYSFPIVCGGIDVTAHVITRSDVDLSSADPAPSSIVDLIDGNKEYIWSLTDVDNQRQNIRLNILFKGLAEGEQRSVVSNAFLEFTNSFAPDNPVQVQLAIPSILASSQMSVTPSVDATQYGPNSNVAISVQVDNGSSDLFTGTLEISVVDANGNLIEQLTPISVTDVAALGSTVLSSQWNTGIILAGAYTININLFNQAGVEVATGVSTFTISTASNTGTVVNTSLSADKQQYESWDVVNISGRVRNITTNVIQLPGNATITVTNPDGTVLSAITYAIRELYPNSYQDLANIINLVEAPAGQYTITLQLTDASTGAPLATSVSNFGVTAATTQALSGTVTAQPVHVNAGASVVCTSEIRNISSIDIADISVSEKLVDVATSQVIDEVLSTQTIAANGTLSMVRTISTASLVPGEYMCLVAGAADVDVKQLAADGFRVLVANNLAPVANAGLDQSAVLGATVTLDGNASSDPDNDVITYQWRLVTAPTGSTAVLSDITLVNPTLLLDAKGTYTFELIVNDGLLDSTPDVVEITVINTQPVANAGTDQSVFVGQDVTLDGTASTDHDGDNLSYQWSIVSKPVGSVSVLSNPTAAMPSLNIDMHGVYELQLVVFDGTVSSTPDSVLLNVGNVKPIANAGLDQAVQIGQTIALDGSDSTDADGDALTYHWTLISKPADSTSVLTTIDNVMSSLVIDSHGTYQVQLVVNDGFEDSNPDTSVLTVVNVVPVANAGLDRNVFINELVTLDGSGSLDADGDVLSYQWSILSKPAASLAMLTDANTMNPSVAIDVYGMYVIQLITNDGIDDSEPDIVVLNVVNLRPVAHAGIDLTVTKGTTVLLDGSASEDADGDALSYRWSLINQPPGSQAGLLGENTIAPEFTTDQPGVYIPQLIVNDGLLDSEPDTVTITAINQMPDCDLAIAVPDSLWPPNHKFKSISLTGISDPDGDALSVSIVGVSQDEPVNDVGDGNTASDAVISNDTVQVRSERSGGGNGRVYHIHFTANDGYDTCTGSVAVGVPHSNNGIVIDDGQYFDSILP